MAINISQPNETEINELLAKIFRSSEFNESKRYQELLKYLVDKSLTVTSLKETEIARDVFGKDSKFDPSIDSLIRSYISNLRKKLEHYYLTTEDEYEFKLEIPRGQYLVKYLNVNKKTQHSKKFSFNPAIYIIIISLLAIVLIWREFGKNSPEITVKDNPVNPIWEEFVGKSSLPTLIVLGDYLVLSEKGKMVNRTFLRVPQINSSNNLKSFSEKEPDKYGNFEISEVTYIGAGTSLGLSYIFNVFGNNSSKVSLKLASQFKWDDFENHNVVYIGSFKCLYKLDTLFSRTNIKYQLNPYSLKLNNISADSSKTFMADWLGGNYQKDFSVILKLIGYKNNSIIFLTGFSEVGIMNAIKTATDPDFISKIRNFSKRNIDQKPLLFEMISEAEGLQNTVFHSQIKYFELLTGK